MISEEKESVETEDKQAGVEFVSNDELSPMQLTKFKLETLDEVDENVEKLTRKVTSEED